MCHAELGISIPLALEIGKAGNNTVTSTESLAGKTIKLTFAGTETAIKCKAEIVE